MTTPRIYYYPDEGGTLEEIDFGEGLSDLQELDDAVVEDAVDGSGQPYRAFWGSILRVRIVLERFGPVGASPLERQLKTFQSHVLRGGVFGFSRNHAKTWAGLNSTTPPRGTTGIGTGGNGFTAWSGAAALTSGDEVVVESAAPECLRDFQTVSSVVGTSVIVPLPGLVYSFDQSCIVRWRDFYPVLWLPKDQIKSIVTHDHRRNFTLDATFEYSPAAALGLWEQEQEQFQMINMGYSSVQAGPLPLRSGTVTTGWGSSLQQLMGPRRADAAAARFGADPTWRG